MADRVRRGARGAGRCARRGERGPSRRRSEVRPWRVRCSIGTGWSRARWRTPRGSRGASPRSTTCSRRWRRRARARGILRGGTRGDAVRVPGAEIGCAAHAMSIPRIRRRGSRGCWRRPIRRIRTAGRCPGRNGPERGERAGADAATGAGASAAGSAGGAGGGGAAGPGDRVGARPMRAAGARVVLHEGALVAYLGRSEETLTTFLPENEPERTRAVLGVARALGALVDGGRRKLVALRTLDGVDAARSQLADTFVSAGFFRNGDSLMRRRAADRHGQRESRCRLRHGSRRRRPCRPRRAPPTSPRPRFALSPLTDARRRHHCARRSQPLASARGRHPDRRALTARSDRASSPRSATRWWASTRTARTW